MIFRRFAGFLNGVTVVILVNLSGARRALPHSYANALGRNDGTASPDITSPPLGEYFDLVGAVVPETANFNSTRCREAFSCFWPAGEMREEPAAVRGCSCHDYCRLFGDCCRDKEQSPATVRRQRLPYDAYVCALQSSFTHTVYVVTSCPTEYANSLVVDACSELRYESTPVADDRSTPVTDRETGVTYGNRDCAACWEIPERRLSTWLWRFTCRQLLRNDGSASHAVNLTHQFLSSDDRGRRRAAMDYVRSQCTLKYSPPPDVKDRLHSCPSGLVHRCTVRGGGVDESSARCSGGPAEYAYSVHSAVYRNRDCAVCDAAAARGVVGSGRKPPTLYTSSPKRPLECQPAHFRRSIPMLSFAVLLTPDGAGSSARGGSSRCVAVEGSPSSRGDWTAAELCRDILAFRAAGVCAAGGGGGGFPCLNDVEKPPACNHSADIGLDADAAYALAAASGGTALESSFAGDTLVVWLNQSTRLCVACIVGRYVNYTLHDDGLLSVHDPDSEEQQRRVFTSPFYSVAAAGVSVCLRPAVSRGNGSAPGGANLWSGCSHSAAAAASAAALCLSLIALALFAAAFALLKYMRRYPGDMVMNQAIAFFVAFTLFLVRPLAVRSPTACVGLAIAVHYFFVSAFVWTTLYALTVARALSFRLPSGGVTRRQRAAYYLLGWGSALLCVGLGIAADARNLPLAPGYGLLPQCFIAGRLGHLALFMAPLCVCLGVDVVVYVYMIAKLAVIARQTMSVRSSHNEKLWLSIRLVFSTGIVWIVAVLASFTGSEALLCIFSLLNALQGVFLFAVFVFKRDTVTSLWQRVTKGRESRRSWNVRPSTQVSAVAV